MVEYPDEWFVWLKSTTSGLRPVVGRESGFLFLSRVGYEANREALKQAFSENRGCSWEDFERHVEKHFRTLHTSTAKLVAKLTKQLADAQAVLGTLR